MTARLVTSLLGKKVHLITDAEAREEAARQGLDDRQVQDITAENWMPAIKKYKELKGLIGEIVAIHQETKAGLVYTIRFGNQLYQLSDVLWRLES